MELKLNNIEYTKTRDSKAGVSRWVAHYTQFGLTPVEFANIMIDCGAVQHDYGKNGGCFIFESSNILELAKNISKYIECKVHELTCKPAYLIKKCKPSEVPDFDVEIIDTDGVLQRHAYDEKFRLQTTAGAEQIINVVVRVERDGRGKYTTKFGENVFVASKFTESTWQHTEENILN